MSRKVKYEIKMSFKIIYNHKKVLYDYYSKAIRRF